MSLLRKLAPYKFPIFIGILLLGFALYRSRVAEVSAPGGSRMFVSSVEVLPATGLEMSKGITQKVKVTISHPWPRPSWWGQSKPGNEINQVVDFERVKPPIFGHGADLASPGENFLHVASGDAVFKSDRGRLQRIPLQRIPLQRIPLQRIPLQRIPLQRIPLQRIPLQRIPLQPSDATGFGHWENGALVFTHTLHLGSLEERTPSIEFRGIYFLDRQPVLHASRSIAGDALPWNRSKDPGAKLVSITPLPFEHWYAGREPIDDICYLTLVASHPPEANGEGTTITDQDWELVDGKGRVVRPDPGGNGFNIGYPGSEPVSTPTTIEMKFNVKIVPHFKLPEPLTLRGKISIDSKWPFQVEVRLPPRKARVKPKFPG